MTNIIWNVIVEWDAVWQQSAKSLLKTIELLRLSLSWPDLCQLVASDKPDLSSGELTQLHRWHPQREFWSWLTINNSQWYPFIQFKSCSTTVASSPLGQDWQMTVHSCAHSGLVSYLLYYFTGAKKLVEKIKEYNPKIAVFNGKGIYEVFSAQHKQNKITQPQSGNAGGNNSQQNNNKSAYTMSWWSQKICLTLNRGFVVRNWK